MMPNGAENSSLSVRPVGVEGDRPAELSRSNRLWKDSDRWRWAEYLGLMSHCLNQLRRALEKEGDLERAIFLTVAVQRVTRHSRNIAQSVATGFDRKGNFRKDARLLVGRRWRSPCGLEEALRGIRIDGRNAILFRGSGFVWRRAMAVHQAGGQAALGWRLRICLQLR